MLEATSGRTTDATALAARPSAIDRRLPNRSTVTATNPSPNNSAAPITVVVNPNCTTDKPKLCSSHTPYTTFKFSFAAEASKPTLSAASVTGSRHTRIQWFDPPAPLFNCGGGVGGITSQIPSPATIPSAASG